MSGTNVEEFLRYYDRIWERTCRVIQSIPREKIDWTYREGKFTFADVIRHLAAVERYMFAENAQLKPSRYPGHGKELADGYDNVVAYADRMHSEVSEIVGSLTDDDLLKKCRTPAGTPITVWKWLRSMVEHQVHHRGQLYVYLGILGVQTPPLYGLTSEEVLERSR